MPAQSRRSAGRPSRAQRRAGAPATTNTARTYTVPQRSTGTASTNTARTYNAPQRTPAPTGGAYVPRRSYAAGPPPLDYNAEYRWIRKDLFRILVWAGLIVVAMIALWFVL